MKKDILDALKHIGIALVFALLIVAAGSSIKAPWLVIPVTPILSGIAAYLIEKKDESKKTRIELIARWGGFGLAAGLLWYLFL